ncbi:MAG: ATP-binding protein [Bacillota bacterium]
MAKIIGRLRLKNMTILQSFIFLNCISLVAVLAAVVLEFELAERIRRQFAYHPSVNDLVLTSLIIMVLFTVGGAIVVTASLFYRLKLKIPLEILMSASEKILANDLGFHIYYDSRDEMSELCRVFEKMRSQLESNYKVLWRSVEERKQLNAIFAHDLRTPLSVLKGYAEFLTTYLPQNSISKEKLLEMIKTMEIHIGRIESHAEAMNSIQKLEDMPVNKHEIKIDHLTSVLDDSAQHLTDQNGKTFDSYITTDSTKMFVDINLVMQVFENMMVNGVRHASSQVKTHYIVCNGIFSIIVTDDGSGFSDAALQKAVLPFYRGEVSEGNAHHGLGLYICKVLCEKHQGSLHVENSSHGGGKVTASFFCGVDK